MGVVSNVAGQFAHPRGRLGSVIATYLNVVNRRLNLAALEALDLAGDEQLLDVGFGGGIGLKLALERSPHGSVTGLEASGDMVRRARKVFAEEVAEGRLHLADGRAEHLPLPDETFDGIYTVSTVFFWSDVPAGMKELARVLRPAGRVVIANSQKVLATNERVFDRPAPSQEDLVESLQAAGMSRVRAERPTNDTLLVVGQR